MTDSDSQDEGKESKCLLTESDEHLQDEVVEERFSIVVDMVNRRRLFDLLHSKRGELLEKERVSATILYIFLWLGLSFEELYL